MSVPLPPAISSPPTSSSGHSTLPFVEDGGMEKHSPPQTWEALLADVWGDPAVTAVFLRQSECLVFCFPLSCARESSN